MSLKPQLLLNIMCPALRIEHTLKACFSGSMVQKMSECVMNVLELLKDEAQECFIEVQHEVGLGASQLADQIRRDAEDEMKNWRVKFHASELMRMKYQSQVTSMQDMRQSYSKEINQLRSQIHQLLKQAPADRDPKLIQFFDPNNPIWSPLPAEVYVEEARMQLREREWKMNKPQNTNQASRSNLFVENNNVLELVDARTAVEVQATAEMVDAEVQQTVKMHKMISRGVSAISVTCDAAIMTDPVGEPVPVGGYIPIQPDIAPSEDSWIASKNDSIDACTQTHAPENVWYPTSPRDLDPNSPRDLDPNSPRDLYPSSPRDLDPNSPRDLYPSSPRDLDPSGRHVHQRLSGPRDTVQHGSANPGAALLDEFSKTRLQTTINERSTGKSVRNDDMKRLLSRLEMEIPNSEVDSSSLVYPDSLSPSDADHGMHSEFPSQCLLSPRRRFLTNASRNWGKLSLSSSRTSMLSDDDEIQEICEESPTHYKEEIRGMASARSSRNTRREGRTSNTEQKASLMLVPDGKAQQELLLRRISEEPSKGRFDDKSESRKVDRSESRQVGPQEGDDKSELRHMARESSVKKIEREEGVYGTLEIQVDEAPVLAKSTAEKSLAPSMDSPRDSVRSPREKSISPRRLFAQTHALTALDLSLHEDYSVQHVRMRDIPTRATQHGSGRAECEVRDSRARKMSPDKCAVAPLGKSGHIVLEEPKSSLIRMKPTKHPKILPLLDAPLSPRRDGGCDMFQKSRRKGVDNALSPRIDTVTFVSSPQNKNFGPKFFVGSGHPGSPLTDLQRTK